MSDQSGDGGQASLDDEETVPGGDGPAPADAGSDPGATQHSALVGFMSVPVHRRFPIRRSTLVMALAFLAFGTWCYLYPPDGPAATGTSNTVPAIPGITSTTTTTTTTAPPPSPTTTRPPSASSTTSTTTGPPAASTTTPNGAASSTTTSAGRSTTTTVKGTASSTTTTATSTSGTGQTTSTP